MAALEVCHIFLFGGKMKFAVCDSRIPEASKKNLYNHCDRIILLPPFSVLAEPVSAHPDMLLFPAEDERIIFTHRGYLDICRKAFAETNYEIVPIEETVSEKYPYDILLNSAKIGQHILGKKAHISSSILDYASKNHLDVTDIKQGYAKCSICKVSENAIISADPSVLKAAEKLNINALKISEGGVHLRGYDRGFIGGASGNDGENVFFCGDIMKHRDGEKITQFCISHGKNAVSLSKEELYDIGTVYFIT